MMLNSRRACLKLGVLTGAVLSLPSLQIAAAAAALESSEGTSGGLLTRSLLAQELNTRFVVWRPGARPVALRLATVGDPEHAGASGVRADEHCFSATFEGAVHAPLGQGTYRVTHATLGDLALFLVPVGRLGRVRTYELAVNRREA
jgi:hypothetical protein